MADLLTVLSGILRAAGPWLGPLLACAAFAEAGVILNVSSVAGMMGFLQPPMAAHAAAKSGVIGLTRQLAVEGAPVGIRAVTISPGAVLSREGDLDQTQRNAVTDRTLLKRWGRPEEVVEAAVFLASDRASYITGANLPIEGGATAW